MLLTISISPETEESLKSKAAAAGVDLATYAARYLELLAVPSKSLKDISGPITDAFADGGMSEDQLSDLLEAEKHAMRSENREKRAG